MPIGKVRLVPGINVEKTPSLNEAGYSVSRLMRWRDGLAQKIGGWQKFYAFSIGSTIRALHGWQDFNDVKRLAVGADESLSVIRDSNSTNITPQELVSDFEEDFSTTAASNLVIVNDPNIDTITEFDSVYFNTPISIGGIILSGQYAVDANLGTNTYRIVAADNATATISNGGLVPEFTTTSGSSSVNVALADHGLSIGDTLNLPIATTVGGVTLQGTYRAIAIPDADNFTISANQDASSSASAFMNGGEAQLLYKIALGPQPGAAGYGTGGYGEGGYGTGTVSSAQTGTGITSNNWTLDNWGETLLACATNGSIYEWTPRDGIQQAQVVANAPAFNRGIFVAMPAQILVAYGSTSTQNIGVNQDPLRVKWSDQLDFRNWTVSTTTQAGSYRIPTGSEIVGGLQASQSALLWTDLDVWQMQYVGFPIVFGFNKIGASCGLIGIHARAELGGIVYWMGKSNFFALTGSGASPIPCTVWDQVFQDLDRDNEWKCVAGANTVFNEVFFFYPSLSGGTGEIDSYVKLNVVEGSWDYGPLNRTAWIDQSVLGNPIGARSNGQIFQHEVTNDADGVPINAAFETGFWRVNDGNEIMFVDWIIPDMRFGKINAGQTAQLSVTFFSRYYPGGEIITHGPFSFDQNTEWINLRIRGREIAMRVESDDVESFWRLGNISYRAAVDGRY